MGVNAPKVVMLEVTLKKAADLSRAALEAADAIEVTPLLAYNIHSTADAAGLLATASADITKGIQQARDLLDAGYALREMIGEANGMHGISRVMTKRRAIDAEIKLLTDFKATLSLRDSEADLETLPSVIATVKARLETGRGFSIETRVTLRASTPEQLAELEASLQALKRERSNIVEMLSRLNLNHTVKLDDGRETVLRTAGLID